MSYSVISSHLATLGLPEDQVPTVEQLSESYRKALLKALNEAPSNTSVQYIHAFRRINTAFAGLYDFINDSRKMRKINH